MGIEKIKRKIRKGRYKSSKAIRMALNSAYRKELKNRATKSEKVFESFLQSRGIKYIFQKGFIKPFHRIVDFYIPKLKIIIEIDGGYHKEIVEKDAHKDRVWAEMGYKQSGLPTKKC